MIRTKSNTITDAGWDVAFWFAVLSPVLGIQGHPFLAKPISIPELIEGIERSLPAHATF